MNSSVRSDEFRTAFPALRTSIPSIRSASAGVFAATGTPAALTSIAIDRSLSPLDDACLVSCASTAAGAIGGVRSGKDRGPTLRTLNQPGPRAGPTLTLTAGGVATFQLHRSKCGSQGLRARNLRVATTALLARSESRTLRQVLTDAFTTFFATDPTAASIAWPASWRDFPTTAAE